MEKEQTLRMRMKKAQVNILYRKNHLNNQITYTNAMNVRFKRMKIQFTAVIVKFALKVSIITVCSLASALEKATLSLFMDRF